MLIPRWYDPANATRSGAPMRPFFWFIFLSALLHVPAEAARPFVTDDARLTTAGSCQLESWTRFYADSTEVWALPACNPTGNLELTLGGGRARYQDTSLSSSEDYVLQAKTLFRTLETNGWGWGQLSVRFVIPRSIPAPTCMATPTSISRSPCHWQMTGWSCTLIPDGCTTSHFPANV